MTYLNVTKNWTVSNLSSSTVGNSSFQSAALPSSSSIATMSELRVPNPFTRQQSRNARRSDRFRCKFSVSWPLPSRRSAWIRLHGSEVPAFPPPVDCQVRRRQTRTSRFRIKGLTRPLWQGHSRGEEEVGLGEGRLEIDGGRQDEVRSVRIAGMLSDGKERNCRADAVLR